MPAIRSLRRFQAGFETTPGTAVAATRLLRGNARIEEQRTTYRPEFPFGVRSAGGGVGTIVSRATAFTVETDATPEEILWPLLAGLADTTPTGSGPYTWTFTAPIAGADPSDIRTMSLEFTESDGATNHLVIGAAYAVANSLELNIEPNSVAMLKWSGFARARQSVSPASATPNATRTLLPSNLWRVWWDTSWSTLGTNLLTTTVRSATWSATLGWEPDYTLDGRTDLDFTALKPTLISAQLQLQVELDAVGAGRLQAWRQNSPAFVRLSCAPSTSASLQIDGSYRLDDSVSFSEDGEVVLAQFTLQGVYDDVSQNLFSIQAITWSNTP